MNERISTILALHDEFLNIQTAVDSGENEEQYRGQKITPARLVEMRALINKKCEKLFRHADGFSLQPGKVFADLMQFSALSHKNHQTRSNSVDLAEQSILKDSLSMTYSVMGDRHEPSISKA